MEKTALGIITAAACVPGEGFISCEATETCSYPHSPKGWSPSCKESKCGENLMDTFAFGVK